MKTMIIILKKIMFAFILVAFISCNHNNIVGEWRSGDERLNTKYTWVFASDGSFKFKTESLRRWQRGSNSGNSIIGNYKIKGNKIVLMHDGKIDEWCYEKHGNHLKLGTEMAGFYELMFVE